MLTIDLVTGLVLDSWVAAQVSIKLPHPDTLTHTSYGV